LPAVFKTLEVVHEVPVESEVAGVVVHDAVDLGVDIRLVQDGSE
jgi:hypothetical protein